MKTMNNNIEDIKKQYANIVCINCIHCDECLKDKIIVNNYNNTRNIKCLSYELKSSLKTF